MLDLDSLPAFCRARVAILGVGNLLFGDDGFGPEVVRRLAAAYHIPDDVYVMDVGTGARKLLFTITLSDARPQEIVIVDAVDWGQEIGRVVAVPVDALPVHKIDDFSLHQVPTSNLLRDLQDHCGVRVTVITCDVGPIVQEICSGLSLQVRQAVHVACQQIAGRFQLLPRPVPVDG